MIRSVIAFGALVFGAWACTKPARELPSEPGQSQTYAFSSSGVRLVTAVQKSGSAEAMLAFVREGKLWLQSSDGGSWSTIVTEDFPFELARAPASMEASR